MPLTGRFWFRKTWTGKLVLLVEEEKPRWLGRRGSVKQHWRDAGLLDLAEPELQSLMTLERTRRTGYSPRATKGLHLVPAPLTVGADHPERRPSA